MGPLAQGLRGCNQSVGQGYDLMRKLYQGRIYFQVYLHDCYQDAVPRGLLDRGLQFLAGCWSEATFSSCHISLFVWHRVSSEQAREKSRESARLRVSKTEITVFYSFILKLMSPHFCHVLFVRSKPLG